MKAFDKIRKVFEAQGGTGFEARFFSEGRCCAIGALYKADGGELGLGIRRTSNYAEIMAAQGVDPVESDEAAQRLYDAHDSALSEALERGLVGVREHSHGDAVAEVGTPAYDFVMDAIKAVCEDLEI